MKVGDKVRKKMAWTEVGRAIKKHDVATGTVIFVHPEGRFYTVEFDLPGGKVRATYDEKG